MEDAVEVEHHFGAGQQFFEGNHLRQGEYVAVFAGAQVDDLHVGRPAGVGSHAGKVYPVDGRLEAKKAFQLVLYRPVRKFHVETVFQVRLVHATGFGTENLLKSRKRGRWQTHKGKVL